MVPNVVCWLSEKRVGVALHRGCESEEQLFLTTLGRHSDFLGRREVHTLQKYCSQARPTKAGRSEDSQ